MSQELMHTVITTILFASQLTMCMKAQYGWSTRHMNRVNEK